MRMRIRDPVIFLTRDPGWRKSGSRIRDKTSRIRNTAYYGIDFQDLSEMQSVYDKYEDAILGNVSYTKYHDALPGSIR